MVIIIYIYYVIISIYLYRCSILYIVFFKILLLLFLLLLLLYVIYILYIYIYFPVSSHLALDFRGFVWTYCVCEIHQLIGGKHPIRVSNLRWWFHNHTQLGTQIQCFIISCRFIEKNGSAWKKMEKTLTCVGSSG